MPNFKTKAEYEKWKAQRQKELQEKHMPPKEDEAAGTPVEQRKYGNKEIFALVGSIIIIIGVFLPFIKAPIIGSINYFNNGKGDGIFLLVFAVGSIVFVLINKLRWLWVTGSSCLIILLYSLINIWDKMKDMEKIREEIKDNPFGGLADTFMQSIQLEVGVPILFLGIALTYTSAILNIKKIV